jgi:hypothetical protein
MSTPPVSTWQFRSITPEPIAGVVKIMPRRTHIIEAQKHRVARLFPPARMVEYSVRQILSYITHLLRSSFKCGGPILRVRLVVNRKQRTCDRSPFPALFPTVVIMPSYSHCPNP